MLPCLGHLRTVGKGQRHVAGARGVKVFVDAALRVHAVEAADHVAVHGVHHRLGHGIVHALRSLHALLHDHIVYRHAVVDKAQLFAGRGQQLGQLLGIAHGHDALAIRTVVGFDHDEGLVLDAVLFVFAANFGQQRIDLRRQSLHARVLGKVQPFGLGKQGMNQPVVNAQHLAKALGHLFIALKVTRFAAHAPAGVQRRQQVLLVQLFQNTRHPGR